MPAWLFILVEDPWSALYNHAWVPALVLAIGLIAVLRRRSHGVPGTVWSPRERWVLWVLTAGALFAFIAQQLGRDLAAVRFVNPDWTTNFIWWKYVTVLAAVLLPLLAVAVILRSARRDVEERVAPTTARDWMTFSNRSVLAGAGFLLAAFAVLMIWTGVTSTQASDGAYRLLVAPGSFTGAGFLEEGRDFFGWSYSLPVVAAVLVVAAASWAVLRENALRPFRRPSTLELERQARRKISSTVLTLSGGAVLLTLAIVLRDTGDAGTPHQGMVLEDGTQVAVGASYEALGRLFIALAAILRTAGLTLLLAIPILSWLPSFASHRDVAAQAGALR